MTSSPGSRSRPPPGSRRRIAAPPGRAEADRRRSRAGDRWYCSTARRRTASCRRSRPDPSPGRRRRTGAPAGRRPGSSWCWSSWRSCSSSCSSSGRAWSSARPWSWSPGQQSWWSPAAGRSPGRTRPPGGTGCSRSRRRSRRSRRADARVVRARPVAALRLRDLGVRLCPQAESPEQAGRRAAQCGAASRHRAQPSREVVEAISVHRWPFPLTCRRPASQRSIGAPMSEPHSVQEPS